MDAMERELLNEVQKRRRRRVVCVGIVALSVAAVVICAVSLGRAGESVSNSNSAKSLVASSPSVSMFTAVGRRIFISDGTSSEEFIIRGFSYSNARIGEGAPSDGSAAEYDSLQRPEICKQDFDLMRKSNVNAIKVYAFNTYNSSGHRECLDAAWNGGIRPIFVALSVWINVLPFPSQDVATNMSDRYTAMVLETADHPAVWSYEIGSEMGGNPNNNSAYWSDFNKIATAILSALGTRKKLISTGTYQADCTGCVPPVPVLGHVCSGEHYNAIVDVWGVDVYRSSLPPRTLSPR
jgi:hypothetical protein